MRFLYSELLINTKNMEEGISVIMPTYNQSGFIRRAISSLFDQTFKTWELIIINDGCTDETEYFISDYLSNPKIKYIKNKINEGLGYAINQGLDMAKYGHISYLPSDDFYFENHLASLFNIINSYDNVAFVYSGMKVGNSDSMFAESKKNNTLGVAPNYSYLQLVQVMHIKTSDRWVNRDEFVTADLYEMYWNKLLDKGVFIPSYIVTCSWTIQPFQRSKLISEKLAGGINKYRNHYKVKTPVKFKTSPYKCIDEVAMYAKFRKKQKMGKESLKILLVGELAYNAERIYALEEAGHMLYGLWAIPSFGFNTVGPLPFGNVKDIPYDNWLEIVLELKPDIIYALLNFTAVPLAYEVLTKIKRSIPFVWHFKEGSSICLRQGTWDKLMYLYAFADGKIFLNKTVKDWYSKFIRFNEDVCLVLDGDLPKKKYFTNEYSERLSTRDGEIHTFIAGRPIGIDNNMVKVLSMNCIHLHIYFESNHEIQEDHFENLKKIAGDYLHIHPHCSSANWVKEFSQYDAGWLHVFPSNNSGDIKRTSWDDLNIPARINTYAAAGVPVILKDNNPNIVATQIKVEELNIGIIFSNPRDLVRKLKDSQEMEILRQNMRKSKYLFSFDNYVPELISFFKKIINNTKNG
jgi:glycosyltransferase involved in cell wall biosynthesis